MIDQPATGTKPMVGTPWKEQLAALIRLRPMKWLMAGGIRLVVPSHRIGVALIAFNAEDELLLLRHVFHPETPWGLPGGWLARHESPAEGLVREMREETNLTVTVGPPAYIAHQAGPSHLYMAYLGWVQPGPVTLSNEILEARWFPLSELPQPEHPFTRPAALAARSLLSIYSSPAEFADRTNLGDNK
ncbi:MAG: NUDIX hydrolase [Chloroflexota bacterium]